MQYFIKYLLVGLLIGLLSCENPSENKIVAVKEIEDVNIRIQRDPSVIHPIFSPSSIGREVFQYIFTPLADFDPETLELSPIIIKEIPEAYNHEVNGESWVTYLMEIREEAKWSDGQPITAKDVKFTLNAINHPNCEQTLWKSFFDELKAVSIGDKNDREFSVSFDASYMLSLEAATTISILPSHIYDPEGLITPLEIYKFRDIDPSEDEKILEVFKGLSESKNQKTNVVQAGPYKLSSFESNQYYQLERIPDYWGKAYPEVPILRSNTEKITLRIVPDEVTAINMLKEDKIDFLRVSNGKTFLELREDEKMAEQFSFHIPQLFRYYYFGINNTSPLLNNKKLRRAIAHIADVNDFIESLEGGLGTPATGHFHPSKPYYNENLKPLSHDINKTRELLAEEGWEDTDDDGILDKTVDGKKQDFEIDLYITGSKLSTNMALLYQESATEAGVKVNIVAKENSVMMKEHVLALNYDISLLVVGQDASTDDPYGRFHSDNVDKTNLNPQGYSNPKADIVIDKLRLERDKEKQTALFQELQEILYDDQPSIFLYSPVDKIAISNRIKATTSSKRPGYMANTFESR